MTEHINYSMHQLEKFTSSNGIPFEPTMTIEQIMNIVHKLHLMTFSDYYDSNIEIHFARLDAIYKLCIKIREANVENAEMANKYDNIILQINELISSTQRENIFIARKKTINYMENHNIFYSEFRNNLINNCLIYQRYLRIDEIKLDSDYIVELNDLILDFICIQTFLTANENTDGLSDVDKNIIRQNLQCLPEIINTLNRQRIEAIEDYENQILHKMASFYNKRNDTTNNVENNLKRRRIL